MNDPIDKILARIKAFVHFRDLHPDQSHTPDELNDAIALAAEVESLRSRLAGTLEAYEEQEILLLRVQLEIEELQAERALIVARAENAEAALVEAEQEYEDARIVREQLEARLAEAEETIAGIPTLCRRYEARLVSEERYRAEAVDAATSFKARLAEIIGYCAQEGHDGEPYDTINAIATGEYSTRGGGKP